MIDPTLAVDRVRLLVGDINKGDPVFEDTIYDHYLTTEGLSETDAAIVILGHVLSLLTLQPEKERIGTYEVYLQNVGDVRKRLDDLEKQKDIKSNVKPMIINPGSSNSYKYLNSLFDEDWR